MNASREKEMIDSTHWSSVFDEGWMMITALKNEERNGGWVTTVNDNVKGKRAVWNAAVDD